MKKITEKEARYLDSWLRKNASIISREKVERRVEYYRFSNPDPVDTHLCSRKFIEFSVFGRKISEECFNILIGFHSPSSLTQMYTQVFQELGIDINEVLREFEA